MQPDLIIPENIRQSSNKGARSKRLTAAIADLANNLDLMDIAVNRVQQHPNKYDEAQFLAASYPELQPKIPKRSNIWEIEPYHMTVFEALALCIDIYGLSKIIETRPPKTPSQYWL